VIRGITVDPPTVVRDQPATFSATVDNGPTGWHWTITDAAGTVLFDSTDADRTTFTPPAGSADNLTVTLAVTNAVGAGAPKSVPFQTTSSLTPQVNGPTASNDAPGIGERVTFDATESVAGGRGQWAWTVTNLDTGATLIDSQPGTNGAAFAQTFTAAGRFRVTLAVSFDGATGRGSADVTVTDRCVLTVASGIVDLTGTTSAGTASAQWSNCLSPTFQPPTVSLPPWLRQTSLTTTPGATGAGTVRIGVALQGTPPDAPNQPGVIGFRTGTLSATADVKINAAPTLANLSCVRTHVVATTWDIDVNYGDPAGIASVVLSVTDVNGQDVTQPMQVTPGSSPPHYFTFVDEAPHPLPDAGGFSIRVTDNLGRSSTLNANLGQCLD
jgi:hypothetical protein